MNDVLTVPAVITALIAGFAVGVSLVASTIRSTRYGSATAGAARFGLLIGFLGVVFLLVFYAGQATASFVEGDPNWHRVVSRGGIAVVYAVAVAIGVWLGLRKRGHA